MTRKFFHFYLVLFVPLILGLASCVSGRVENNFQTGGIHNSMNSLDWAGVYAGEILTAENRSYYVSIAIDYDGAFNLAINRGIDADAQTLSGIFEWDETGGIITLKNTSEIIPRFRVGENVLIQLFADSDAATGSILTMLPPPGD